MDINRRRDQRAAIIINDIILIGIFLISLVNIIIAGFNIDYSYKPPGFSNTEKNGAWVISGFSIAAFSVYLCKVNFQGKRPSRGIAPLFLGPDRWSRPSQKFDFYRHFRFCIFSLSSQRRIFFTSFLFLWNKWFFDFIGSSVGVVRGKSSIFTGTSGFIFFLNRHTDGYFLCCFFFFFEINYVLILLVR